ncbi:MAG: hypothetical protein ACEPOW_09275 [Bacteroidales bacterium]
MKKATLITLILGFILFSCRNQEHKFQSKVLKTYLSKNYSIKDLEDKKYLIIIPAVHCKGCVIKGLRTLNQIIKKKRNNILLIHYSNSKIPKSLENKIDIRLDKKNEISDYNLKLGSISVFELKNLKIKNANHFIVSNLHEIKNLKFNI